MSPKSVSATAAKLQFGTFMAKVKNGAPLIIEKNNMPEIVWISVDDYEDFLELKDPSFQKSIKKSRQEMKRGKAKTISALYKIHRNTIIKEA